jgi:RND family efflux transporter MFP subunit
MVRNSLPARALSLAAVCVLLAACCLATQTATAQDSLESKVYEFKGKVIATREAEIAARVDGRLAKINFATGQIVKKGDLLFEFDVKFRQLALDAARAQQKVMEAQLQLADVKLKNAEALQARNVSSEMQVLEAQAQQGIAAANVDAAKANVGIAQLQLDQTKLFAPIDGMISQSFVREGAYLTLEALDQNRLAVIIQLDPIKVVGEVPFDAYAERREMFDIRKTGGEMLEYTLVLPNGEKYPHTGRLVEGTGEFDPPTQAMAVAVEFENPEFLLRPGLTVTLQSSVRRR